MALSVEKQFSALGWASGAPPGEKPAEQLIPKFVPRIAIVVVAMASLLIIFSPPNSHVRRSLCTAFASLDAANCPAIASDK
jgi:hypothetical protein